MDSHGKFISGTCTRLFLKMSYDRGDITSVGAFLVTSLSVSADSHWLLRGTSKLGGLTRSLLPTLLGVLENGALFSSSPDTDRTPLATLCSVLCSLKSPVLSSTSCSNEFDLKFPASSAPSWSAGLEREWVSELFDSEVALSSFSGLLFPEQLLTKLAFSFSNWASLSFKSSIFCRNRMQIPHYTILSTNVYM